MGTHSFSTEQIQTIAGHMAAIAGAIPANTTSKSWRQVRASATSLAALLVVEASDPDAPTATKDALDALTAQVAELDRELERVDAEDVTEDDLAAAFTGIVSAVQALSARLAAVEAVLVDDPPAPPPPRTARLGASTMRTGPGTSQGWTTVENLCGGRLEVRRIFLGGLAGKAFPTWSDSVTRYGLDRVDTVLVTFRDDPAAIASRAPEIRAYCAGARAWCDAVPGRQVVIDFHHEPEDNVERGEFTREAWAGAATRVIAYAEEAGIRGGVCLMGWTWDARSGRKVADWLGPIDRRAVVLIDPYWLPNDRKTPAELFGPIRADLMTRGAAAWGVAETGVNPGSMTPEAADGWMRQLVDYARTSDALAICYFDGTGTLGDHYLTPSMATILGEGARS